MNTLLLWAVPVVLLLVVAVTLALRRRTPSDKGRAALADVPLAAPANPTGLADRPLPGVVAEAGSAPAAAVPTTAQHQAASEALRQARRRAAAEATRHDAEHQAQLQAAEQARDQAREQALRQAREQAHQQALVQAKERARRLAEQQAAQAPRPASASIAQRSLPLPRPAQASTAPTGQPPVVAPVMAPRPAAPLPARSGQPVVLLADDSKVVRVKTGRLLEKLGCRVLLAEDGDVALRLLDSEQPDLLITDVEMPGVDGFALTRRLRAHPRWGRLPVIMITSSDDRHRAEARAAGVDVLLGKPYAEETLLGHVQQRLGARLRPVGDGVALH